MTLDSAGIGLRLSVASPEGKTLIQTPCTYEDPVRFDLLAEQAGNFTFNLVACGGEQSSGTYTASIDEVRAEVAGDSKRVAATKALIEAERSKALHTITADREAVQEYQSALILWQSVKDTEGEIKTLLKIGEMLQLRGERPAALEHFKQALTVVWQASPSSNQSEILNHIGHLQILMGDSEQGLHSCLRALELTRNRADQRDAIRARSIAGEAYFDMGDMKKSLAYLQTAFRLAQESKEIRQQAQTLLRTGYVRLGLGDIKEAAEAHREALSRFRLLQDYHGEAFVLAALGHLNSRTGNKQKALDYYNEATSLLTQMEDPILQAEVSAGLGYVYSELGELHTALGYYQQSQALYRARSDHLGEATADVVLGSIYHSLGEEEKALDFLNRGSRIPGNQSGPAWRAYLYEQIGSVHEALKQEQAALADYTQALSLSRQGQNPRMEVSILNRLGRLQAMRGEGQVASTCFNKALVLARSLSDKFGQATSLYNLASLQGKLGHWDEALECIDSAIGFTEQLRSNVASQNLRASYFAASRQSYELNVRILMQLYRQRKSQNFEVAAFDLSERSRARSLLESLKEATANLEEAANPDLLDRERELERTLNAKAERRMQLLSSKQTDEVTAVTDEINQLTIAYDAVRTQIKSQSPRYAALTQPQPLRLAEIQQRLLDDNTILLEYMLGDEHSFLWVVSRTELFSYDLPGRAQIEDAALGLYRLLSAQQPQTGETFEQLQARIHEQLPSQIAIVSKILLEPAADKLGTKRLLIVSDGALQYIPFQALTVPTKAGGGETGASGATIDDRPLILDHEIISEPSASTLALVMSESEKRKPAPKSVAILADPVFNVADSRIKTPSAGPLLAANSSPSGAVTRALRDVGVAEGEIPRLLSSREEADAIMSMVPWHTGFKAVGFDASRAMAMGPDLGQYRVVHFATHALMDNEHPDLSGIVLSLVDQKGQSQDGFLRLHDIYNLKLPVDLVVLSACQTGLGKEVKGEGLIGLTRGFMYAGASGVVASLWKVDDEATAELMKHFYAGMFEKGLSPAAALREAQLGLRQQKRWQEPYYWAGFVIQGQYAAPARAGYNLTPAMKLTVFSSLGLIFSLLVFLALWRRRRRNV